MMASRDNVTLLLRVLVGPGIWFVCLSILYAIATTACVGLLGGIPFAVASWTIALASVAALIWITAFGLGNDPGDALVGLVTKLLAIVSLVGVLWLLLPLAALQIC